MAFIIQRRVVPIAVQAKSLGNKDAPDDQVEILNVSVHNFNKGPFARTNSEKVGAMTRIAGHCASLWMTNAPKGVVVTLDTFKRFPLFCFGPAFDSERYSFTSDVTAPVVRQVAHALYLLGLLTSQQREFAIKYQRDASAALQVKEAKEDAVDSLRSIVHTLGLDETWRHIAEAKAERDGDRAALADLKKEPNAKTVKAAAVKKVKLLPKSKAKDVIPAGPPSMEFSTPPVQAISPIVGSMSDAPKPAADDTEHLLSSPANAKRLKASIAAFKDSKPAPKPAAKRVRKPRVTAVKLPKI